VRHRLELAAVYLVRGLIRAMPRGVVRPCGRLLGLAFYLFDGVHRGVADTNLAMAFPQRTPTERRTITREMFGHFGCVLLELLKFSTLAQDDMRGLVEFEGDDRARAAYARGKGVLFFTGHFGYWEINALVHALRLQPFAVLARPLDNPGLHQLLEQVRTSTGNTVIYRQGAIRRVLRVLQSGQGVAMLIDQHMHSPDAIYVNFFERPAATTSMLAALALRTGAPVVPVFALPLPGGRYRMIYEHAVDPPDADTPDALREFTQRCTDVLEMYVRRHPSLWLWMHRRWRDAPLPEGTPGMFPPARAEETE
jgi:Kdo2-lipid IVA lauroyltransferase/acyltransferase